jgi:hypothetical protein
MKNTAASGGVFTLRESTEILTINRGYRALYLLSFHEQVERLYIIEKGVNEYGTTTITPSVQETIQNG